MLNCRRKMLAAALALVALSALAVAQAVVSPKWYANRRGDVRATDKFSPIHIAGHRWQAIHTDLRGKARTFRQIAFRHGDFNELNWRIDVELRLGVGDFARRSNVFDKNYAGQPTVAVRKRTIFLPPNPKNPPGGYPTPFAIKIPFDAPWAYDGKQDLVYEIHQFRNFGLFQYTLDAVLSDSALLETSSFGQGCVATGQTSPMTLRGFARTFGRLKKHTFQWSVRLGPAFERSTFLIAARAQELFVQNLCTHYYVDSVFSAYTMFADATGSFSTPLISIPFEPGIVGAPIHVQAYSLDNGRHPALFPVSATNRASLRIPARPPSLNLATIRAAGIVPTGSLEDGKALIVELR